MAILRKTESGTEPIAGQVNTLTDVLNALFPVGSYSFGTHPTIGTWIEVEGDRALWLKSSVADGTLISEALPNITGNFTQDRFGMTGGSHISKSGAFTDSGTGTTSSVSSSYDNDHRGTNLDFNAHNSNEIYQDGAHVQPNAYVMKVYKRTG